MPKKGGHRGRRGRRTDGANRELLIKEDNEEYAQVLKILGGERMEVQCMDNVKRIAKVRGKFKKRIWINLHDIILVCLREADPDKCDIIHRYYPDEAKQLKQMGEIPSVVDISKISEQQQQLDIKFETDEKEEAEKPKVKTEKQNIADFMPESDSESDDEDPKAVVRKPKEAPAQVAPKPVQGSTRAQQLAESESDKEESDKRDDSSAESDKEYDPLSDV